MHRSLNALNYLYNLDIGDIALELHKCEFVGVRCVTANNLIKDIIGKIQTEFYSDEFSGQK